MTAFSLRSEEEENVDSILRGYEMWRNRDPGGIDYWMGLIADDVRWRSITDGAPGMEFSRECSGKDDVRRYFAELAADWQMVEFQLDEVIAQRDRVVAVGTCAWRHIRTGRTVSTPKVDLFRMKDGKVTEFFEMFDTAKAYAAARG